MEVDGAHPDPIIGATLLVLAGGESRRMGRPKALLPVGGTTLIEWQLTRLRPAFAETLIAVASPDQLPKGLQDLAVRDREGGRGPLAGLAAGFGGALHDTVFALAVDVPAVTPGLARGLLALLRRDAVVPRSAGGVEPLAAAYRRERAQAAAEAALAAGELRLTDFLGRLEVDFVDLPPFANLNSPREYHAFLDNQA